MMHFLGQLQHYFLFEVIEMAWNELERTIHSDVSMDLDALIQAHESYLESILNRGLFSMHTAIAESLGETLDLILRYTKIEVNCWWRWHPTFVFVD